MPHEPGRHDPDDAPAGGRDVGCRQVDRDRADAGGGESSKVGGPGVGDRSDIGELVGGDRSQPGQWRPLHPRVQVELGDGGQVGQRPEPGAGVVEVPAVRAERQVGVGLDGPGRDRGPREAGGIGEVAGVAQQPERLDEGLARGPRRIGPARAAEPHEPVLLHQRSDHRNLELRRHRDEMHLQRPVARGTAEGPGDAAVVVETRRRGAGGPPDAGGVAFEQLLEGGPFGRRAVGACGDAGVHERVRRRLVGAGAVDVVEMGERRGHPRRVAGVEIGAAHPPDAQVPGERHEREPVLAVLPRRVERECRRIECVVAGLDQLVVRRAAQHVGHGVAAVALDGLADRSGAGGVLVAEAGAEAGGVSAPRREAVGAADERAVRHEPRRQPGRHGQPVDVDEQPGAAVGEGVGEAGHRTSPTGRVSDDFPVWTVCVPARRWTA
ncbi:MAG: hypothetical protein ABS80_03285 [Pseudonocardia sp. SCN 72-51]|nr:MAG: hypothetical protein ABS80_03285 [Pseudonocardia sp. SCN 72-51]